MVASRVRIVGSNYSTFRWNGNVIAYLSRIDDSGVTPVAIPEEIMPLGEEHPIEYAVARALHGGTLTFTISELWDSPVWQHLQGLEDANDILDVWKLISAMPSPITCQTIIAPPSGAFYRVKTYHNIIVTDIDDSETIAMATMTIPRKMTCQYTHATRATVQLGSTPLPGGILSETAI